MKLSKWPYEGSPSLAQYQQYWLFEADKWSAAHYDAEASTMSRISKMFTANIQYNSNSFYQPFWTWAHYEYVRQQTFIAVIQAGVGAPKTLSRVVAFFRIAHMQLKRVTHVSN